MRTFIAIELPEDIKEAIGRLQDKLKRSGADVKWVAPANIHLTLKFLGEIDEQTKNMVSEAVSLIGADTPDFSMRLGSIGAFPSLRSPRVLWIGLSQGNEQARAVFERIEAALEKCAIPKETRPFASHITIARVRGKNNIRGLIDILTGQDKITEDIREVFQAGKITFFKSTLTPRGPVYEVLQAASLRTA